MTGLLICQADARRIPLRDESVQCVVTSPPYWSLRKYAGAQDLIWGGEASCVHEWTVESRPLTNPGRQMPHGDGRVSETDAYAQRREPRKAHLGVVDRSNCQRCRAWRGAYGLEPAVEMYVQHTIEILREIRRVLRKDGVCFWNIGDSYCAAPKGSNKGWDKSTLTSRRDGTRAIEEAQRASLNKPGWPPSNGLKPKDMCLIPARVALAAQADGWWVRSDIIWAKPNPMPESVTDRPTDAYEHILMLTKSARYFWDGEAVKEPQTGNAHSRGTENGNRAYQEARESYYDFKSPQVKLPGGRNLRNVWWFPMQPYKGAHFATFPEELPRRCILAATKVEDLVLDPFAGSRTTGRVAVELNRRCVLLDLAYFDHAEKRTRNIQRELLSV